jgi:hypothetical protein
MASMAIRERRRTLRYRNLLVRNGADEEQDRHAFDGSRVSHNSSGRTTVRFLSNCVCHLYLQ